MKNKNTLRRLLVLDGVTGLLSVLSFAALSTTWADACGVTVADIHRVAWVLAVYVVWIGWLLWSYAPQRLRVLIAANAAYVVACAAIAAWGVASGGLTTIGVLLALSHAVFVAGLTVAQRRALRPS